MRFQDYIDHTLLKATATEAQIKKLCAEAVANEFYAVCVNSGYVSLAKKELHNSKVKLAAVIGFPLGAMATTIKVTEAAYCMEMGADEVDMVINVGWLKDGLHTAIIEEIQHIKSAVGNGVLKVIIETCYLTPQEIITASKLVIEGGADFVKTSTGFGTSGATLEDVKSMKETVGDTIKIKASGGIRDKATAMKYIELGVSRIGTSSGVAMMNS
ncbi:MAG: deoxyribose-phosphate aldolase [Eudoraea sp.]|nr:deoxyribose-phosphate aldolase [Eudoraea sp.]